MAENKLKKLLGEVRELVEAVVPADLSFHVGDVGIGDLFTKTEKLKWVALKKALKSELGFGAAQEEDLDGMFRRDGSIGVVSTKNRAPMIVVPPSSQTNSATALKIREVASTIPDIGSFGPLEWPAQRAASAADMKAKVGNVTKEYLDKCAAEFERLVALSAELATIESALSAAVPTFPEMTDRADAFELASGARDILDIARKAMSVARKELTSVEKVRASGGRKRF